MTLSDFLRERLAPSGGRPGMREIHRVSMERMNLARRQGDGRTARMWRRLMVKARRVLRFAVRMRAGRARGYPACSGSSHPLFSDVPETVRETPAAVAAPRPARRGAFREGRWRC